MDVSRDFGAGTPLHSVRGRDLGPYQDRVALFPAHVGGILDFDHLSVVRCARIERRAERHAKRIGGSGRRFDDATAAVIRYVEFQFPISFDGGQRQQDLSLANGAIAQQTFDVPGGHFTVDRAGDHKLAAAFFEQLRLPLIGGELLAEFTLFAGQASPLLRLQLLSIVEERAFDGQELLGGRALLPFQVGLRDLLFRIAQLDERFAPLYAATVSDKHLANGAVERCKHVASCDRLQRAAAIGRVVDGYPNRRGDGGSDQHRDEQRATQRAFFQQPGAPAAEHAPEAV